MPTYTHQIAILGAGTIGLSMASLHLRRPDTKVTIYDPNPSIKTQIHSTLPGFLSPGNSTSIDMDHLLATRLSIANSIQEAVSCANIIQEQSPEITASKQALWKEVEGYAHPEAHLWSSSSGIAATEQGALCGEDIQRRLLVVHPFNPPHIMPLIEIVPGRKTGSERVEFVRDYFGGVPGPEGSLSGSGNGNGDGNGSATKHYRCVILHKEVPGFVGNRLAFALLREACYLVGEGVVSVADLDTLIMASLGPRWAGSGVFESYHAGGGEGGIGGFLQKLGPTMKEVWGGLGQVGVSVDGRGDGGDVAARDEGWRDVVVLQTEEAYGACTSAESRVRKEGMLRGVVEMQKERLE